ncbi:hypothetical protein H4I95_02999 [Botrytis cinerea]
MGTNNAKISYERPTEVQQFIDSEMVDIHVGEDEDSGHFKLHKSILCDKVPYFENMFNGNFIEGTTNSASLPEDDPEVFNMLVSWIYSDQVGPLEQKIGDDGRWCVGNLYLLADKLCLPDLMDQILDELTFHMERKNWIPRISMTRSPISMESLYNCSPRKNCGMFRLTASIICYLLCEAQGAIYPKYWPTEDIDAFLTSHDDLRHEVFKMIRAQRNEMAFEEQVFYPGCRFHEHEEGQPCSQRTAR